MGEPGVGKTAVLADALRRADGMRVLRATGWESESHLPFSGLLQLLRPALHLVEDLATPQGAALRGALGLGPAARRPADGESGDRFMIGAAVLELLSRYADQGPVVVAVDDLHALDLPSAEALVFAARRLTNDPVAVVATARSPDADQLVTGLPVMRLEGLDPDSARTLVARAAGEPLVPDRLEPLLALAGGNPLALLELADDDLDALATGGTGPTGLPARVPLAVGAAFARRLDLLADDARTAVLVAAVAGGDPGVVARACAALGVEPETLADAEDLGLLQVRSGEVAFRHPLVRSAAYSVTTARRRREVHAAVADALPEHEADRRAWHRAEAVWQPDEEIAAQLAAAADRARARRAYAVASGGYERAARLSVEPDRRDERRLLAAETAWSAGLTARTVALLDADGGDGGGDRARTPSTRELALRGAVAARTGHLREARDLLVAAADGASDPADQCVLLADAVHANFYLAGAPAAARLAQRLVALTPDVTDPRARALGLIATGMARMLVGERGGAEDLRRAVPLIEASPELLSDPHRVSCVMLVPLFLRDTSSARTLRAHVDRVRAEAGVGALPAVLFHVARDQATSSSWSEAEAGYVEAVRLAEETGQVTERLMSLAGLCWLESRQGREAECRRHAADVLDPPEDVHLPMGAAWVRFALGDLELSRGDPAAALEQLAALDELLTVHELGDVDLVAGPEQVEALLRLERVTEARHLTASYRAAAEAKGQPWSLARAARAQGLVTGAEGAAEPCFEEALRLHEATLDRFETARTRLAYGGWLRRAARRVDARAQLRQALDGFEDLGAARWAEVAARELAATGETVRRRDADPRSTLTPQELQVSLLLVEGRTTREAAAALFLSPKTVEYHLRKVYTKLGIGSRHELAEVLAER